MSNSQSSDTSIETEELEFASHPCLLLPDYTAAYSSQLGAAFVADSSKAMKIIPDSSINLVVTSPPYALHFKKEYGNVSKDEYVTWFLPFAEEIHRILKDDGSFVLNIGGSYNAGHPTRSLYQYKLLIALCEITGFHLAQELYWYNPAKLPAPAEWVNVRRIRVKDSVEHLWWFGKTEWPKANNRQVLTEYSQDMKRLIKNGYKAKMRPSGHNITDKFQDDHGGAIPSNLLTKGNNQSNSSFYKRLKEAGKKMHPARFPEALPKFFIEFLTDPYDIVLDPFAGSNTTGSVAESLQRRWIAIELDAIYVQASEYRFGEQK